MTMIISAGTSKSRLRLCGFLASRPPGQLEFCICIRGFNFFFLFVLVNVHIFWLFAINWIILSIVLAIIFTFAQIHIWPSEKDEFCKNRILQTKPHLVRFFFLRGCCAAILESDDAPLSRASPLVNREFYMQVDMHVHSALNSFSGRSNSARVASGVPVWCPGAGSNSSWEGLNPSSVT